MQRRPAAIHLSTRFWAEITVLWLRRPKNSPISLKAARVCFRASHMASIRGWLTRRVLPSDCRSGGSRPKTLQTAFSMSPSRTTRLCCRIISPRASSARGSEIFCRRASLVACKRQMAPESSRACPVSREATNRCTSAGNSTPSRLAMLRHDPQPRGVIGRLDAADHAAGQPGDQFGHEVAQFGRRPIGGEDQLPAVAQQRVDRVHQLDLGRPLAGQELQVVEDQHVHAAILAAKDRQAAAPQGFEELAGELLGGEIDGRRAAARLPLGRPDPFQEMRLADARGTVDEQRRDLPRVAGDHFGGNMASRLLCPVTNDESEENFRRATQHGSSVAARLRRGPARPGHARCGAGRGGPASSAAARQRADRPWPPRTAASPDRPRRRPR